MIVHVETHSFISWSHRPALNISSAETLLLLSLFESASARRKVVFPSIKKETNYRRNNRETTVPMIFERMLTNTSG